MYIRVTLGRELDRPGAHRPLPGGFLFSLHISYAIFTLATLGWWTYLRLVQFHSSSQKLDLKRGNSSSQSRFSDRPASLLLPIAKRAFLF